MSDEYDYERPIRNLRRNDELNSEHFMAQRNGHEEVMQEDDIQSEHSSDGNDRVEHIERAPRIDEEKLRRDSTSSEEEVRRVEEIPLARESTPPSQIEKQERPPLKRDYTQQSVSGATRVVDENDWAIKNQGKGAKVLDLIARFNKGEPFKKEGGTTGGYKTDYGIGKEVGQLRQDKFH
jgi:hypothetical protein